MAIRVACPACQANYDIEETFRGKQVVCSRCNQRFQIGGTPMVEPVAEVSQAGEVRAAVGPAGPKKKSHLMAWLVLGGTFFLVVGVVVFVLIYLILTLGEDDSKDRQAKRPAQTRPRAPEEDDNQGGAAINDPQADQPANHENPSLRPADDGLYHFHTRVLAPMDDGRGVKASNADMASDVKQRVKRATVLIRAERGDTGGSGTGFFCFEKGLVVTNAHVVGMMSPSDPKPTKLEVVLNSNQPDELTLVGRVLHVDRRMDLALVSVPLSSKLPEPLPLVSSETLEELQRVAVVGFPYGEGLGKDVTMSATSVSSLRRDPRLRTLREVQVSGGMNPGNSGGPVVDSLGRVIGVAVRIRVERNFGGMQNTGLNFAVPSDYAYHLAKGNVPELSLFPPVKEGSTLQLPLQAMLVDPRGNVRKVYAECWTGTAGPERAGGHVPPAKEPGDGDRASQELKLSSGRLAGTVTLPAGTAGQTYWVQLVLEGKDGKKCWTSAHSFKADARQTLQRVPWNPRPANTVQGPANWEATFDGDLHNSGSGIPLAAHVANHWDEVGPGSRKQKKWDVGLRLGHRALSHNDVARLLGHRPQGGGSDDTRSLSNLGRHYYNLLNGSVQKLVSGLEPVLPDRPLQPMESWRQKADFPLESLMVSSTAPEMGFEFTYLGQFQKHGRDQAVIAIAGDRPPTSSNRTYARLTGLATVDMASRKVTYLYAVLNAETEGSPGGLSGALGGNVALLGSTEFRLKRELTGE